MGGELGVAVRELAGRAGTYLKEAVPKLWSNELTKVGVRSGETTVRKTGPFGDVLIDSYKKFTDGTAQDAGQAYSELLNSIKPHMKDPKITKDLATHWQNYDNLPAGPLKDTITKGKMIRMHIYTELQRAGVKVGPMVQDDWPRHYPRDMFEGRNLDDAISGLKRQGLSTRQAESILTEITGRGQKAHTYETPRKWDLPGYRRDFGALLDDIDKGYKRLNFVKVFGPKEEGLDLILAGIKEQSGKEGYDLANKYLDVMMKNTMKGSYYRRVGKLEQGQASLEVATKLGLAVLSHTTQPLNLAVYGGRLRPMVKAMVELVVQGVKDGNLASAEDFSLRAGSTWTETMRRYKELYGTETNRLGSKILHATGFVSFDKYRRIYASVTGKHLAQDLFQEIRADVRPDVARKKLAQMGIDVDQALKRGSLSEDDLLQAAKRTSDTTQFVFDANQLPMAWKASPTARVMLQFKQYFYTQAKFIKDFALKPAVEYLRTGGASGEIRPLIYMSLLYPTFGELTSDIREFARKGTLEERPQFPLERLIDNSAHAGAFGIFQDLIYNIASPSDTPMWHFVAGPTLSDIVDLSHLPHSKRPMLQLEEEALRRVPAVGPIAAYRLRESSRVTPRKKGFLERGEITHYLEDLFK
jgi:hypothetical protein